MTSFWDSPLVLNVMIAMPLLFLVFGSEVFLRRYRREPAKYGKDVDFQFRVAYGLALYMGMFLLLGVSAIHDLGQRGWSTLGPFIMAVQSMLGMSHEIIFIFRLRRLRKAIEG